MHRSTALLFACTLALPLAVGAAPTTVTATSSGTLEPHSIILGNMGWEQYYDVFNGPPVPYTLSFSAVFDPDKGTLLQHGDSLSQMDSDLDISFRVGDEVFAHQGEGRALIQKGERFFDFSATMTAFSFGMQLTGEPGSFAGAWLLPRRHDQDSGLDAYVRVEHWPANPDAPGFWIMRPDAASYTLSVLGPVPEPSRAGMLLAALLAGAVSFAWRRRAFLAPALVVQHRPLPRRAACKSTRSSCSTPSRPPSPIS
ncbi:hypothetical protein B0920_05630 [Massilia sp. KIM]|uniref:hypothetical protein n=1 Tax=Massilia sp. KIM TaxID=1955422 RepID=UPI00098F8E00|nr:hypothetical protein [Massilia sp. KIM]OON62908.1 hypothetical protein B0920_05630 [Massilia sp. KIM]